MHPSHALSLEKGV